jgi:hypothetical protein
MLKKILIGSIFFLSLFFTVQSLEIKSCGISDRQDVCILGEPCFCTIEGCTKGNLAVFYKDLFQPLCYPKIIDGEVQIDLVVCDVNKDFNVTAVCDEGISNSKKIIFIPERPPACFWNETTGECQKNTDSLAEKCKSGYSCIAVKEGVCECNMPTTTRIYTNTTTTARYESTIQTTTTISRKTPCPYQCCEDMSNYEDLFCDDGYVCCPTDNNQYYCKEGNSCIETRRSSGFLGWFLIILIIALLAIGGTLYYLSRSKVNVQNKYRF